MSYFRMWLQSGSQFCKVKCHSGIHTINQFYSDLILILEEEEVWNSEQSNDAGVRGLQVAIHDSVNRELNSLAPVSLFSCGQEAGLDNL